MKKIVLKNQTEIRTCIVDEIAAITCSGDCTTVHFTTCEKTFNQSKTLRYFEDLLLPPPNNYMIISKKALVNLNAIRTVNKSNRSVELLCGRSFGVSVRKLNVLINALESLS